MNIQIDVEKVQNSPYECLSGGEEQEVISQLESQLLHGTPSCFLVSGYRGAGKTSLIRKVQKKLEQHKNVLFVYLNFTKFEKHSLVLRRIIREIYLDLSENEVVKNALIKKEKNLYKALQLLYDRTFYEVTSTSSYKRSNETYYSLDTKINFKKILSVFAVLLVSLLDLKFKLIPFITANLSFIIAILASSFAFIEAISIGIQLNDKKSAISEINSKSLYDDEIAEHHLKSILRNLKSIEIGGEKVKLVIILDELDKIDKPDEIKALLSELKPIMLADLASFFIVSGQSLYYEFAASKTVDDSLISSIFSRQVHVKLLSVESFKNVFKDILQNKNDTISENAGFYLDSLILNSNRVIRRFINLILQDVVWSGENAPYIYLDEKSIDILKTDSKLLNVISRIIEEHIHTTKYAEGIKDFFIIQLHIWVQRIKLKGKLFFKKEEIFDFGKDYVSPYPQWCSNQLGFFCSILLEKLVDANLLEKKHTDSNGVNEEIYCWSENVALKKEEVILNQDYIKSQFLFNISWLKRFIESILSDVKVTNKVPGKNTGFVKSIGKLTEMGIVSENWLSKNSGVLEAVEKYTEPSAYIADGDMFTIQTLFYKLNQIIGEFLVEYTYYSAKQYFPRINYTISQNGGDTVHNTVKFDFIAYNNDKTKEDLLFDIQHSSSVSGNSSTLIHLLLSSLENYNKLKAKNNKLILFIYCADEQRWGEEFRSKFYKFLAHENTPIERCVKIFLLNDNDLIYLRNKIEGYFYQAMS